VIVGKDVTLIEQILRVLTYFIRCSELAENTEVCPLLTDDIDDTATLMSVSDTASPPSCFAVDLTSSDSASTSVKSVTPVSGENLQSIASDSSSAFVLKPVSSSNVRSIRVRFNGGDNGTSECSISTSSKSSDQTLDSTVVDNHTASNSGEVTTPVVMERQSISPETDTHLVPKPHLLFCSDVPDAMPPLLGVTCSGCSYIQPCEECSFNLKSSKLKDVSQRDDDETLVGSCESSLRDLSDTPSCPGARTAVATDCRENLPTSDSPKLCQLSPAEANENVRVERVAHVGREQTQEPQSMLLRVPLEKPVVGSPSSHRGSRKSPVVAAKEHARVELSRIPQYQRSNSMFDEYFDDNLPCPVINLCMATRSKSADTHDIDDTSALDEIMNEPCPDVSHVNASQLSSGSSSSGMVPNSVPDSRMSPSDNTLPQSSVLLEMVPRSTKISAAPSSSPATFDNVFEEQHFALKNSEEHLDDIPDGPSKQMISSTIRLMQDVCWDRTSQGSIDELADIPASDYFSMTGLGGPSRGRQRHPSGQSNTSARCR